MKKIHKILNIALIFMLVGVFLWAGSEYSWSSDLTLRPPSRFNKLGALSDTRTVETPKVSESEPIFVRHPKSTEVLIRVCPKVYSGEVLIQNIDFARGEHKTRIFSADGRALDFSAISARQDFIDLMVAAHPGRKWTAFANPYIGQNIRNVYWAGNTLIKTRGLDISGQDKFCCFIVYRDGTKEIAEVNFKSLDKGKFAIVKNGQDISSKVSTATSVVSIFEEKTDRAGIMGISEHIDDPRHIFLHPVVNKSEKKYFVGMPSLVKGSKGRANALKGEPVWIQLDRELTFKEIRQAFGELGYTEQNSEDEVREKGERGYYYIDEKASKAFVIYKWGLYPHTVVCITKKGDLVTMVAPGKSGRTGSTIMGLQRNIEDYNKKHRGYNIKAAGIIASGGDTWLLGCNGTELQGIVDAPDDWMSDGDVVKERHWLFSAVFFLEPIHEVRPLRKLWICP